MSDFNVFGSAGINSPEIMAGFVDMSDNSFAGLIREFIPTHPELRADNTLEECLLVKNLISRKVDGRSYR